MAADISSLSPRGQQAASPANKMEILNILNNLWDPVSNPHGFVSLGIAENVSWGCLLNHTRWMEGANFSM